MSETTTDGDHETETVEHVALCGCTDTEKVERPRWATRGIDIETPERVVRDGVVEVSVSYVPEGVDEEDLKTNMERAVSTVKSSLPESDTE
jgi:hypothetical protein